MCKLLCLFVALAVIIAPCIAAAEGKAPSNEYQQIARQIQAYRNSSKATVAVSVVDIRDWRYVIDVNGSEPLIPASNQKLLTSAFALARLGPDFEFTTNVYRVGDDLVVIGDGDPTLGDPQIAKDANVDIYRELDRWAGEISQAFPQGIPGDLLVCSRLGLKELRHPDWPTDQHHRWYAAPVSGLNFHNNCFDVTFTVTGRQVVSHIQPQSRFIRVVSAAAVGKRHLWSLRATEQDSSLLIKGTAQRTTDEPFSVAVNHPGLLLGRVLGDRMVRAGMSFSGKIRYGRLDANRLGRATLLCSRQTPLSVAMTRANKRSLNMAAECIFLRAGDGTWDRSAMLMGETLRQRYGLDANSLTVRDGGGLSRNNRITANAMAQLLAGISRENWADRFLASLPVGGVDGTLRKRLTEPTCRGRILAKTGRLAGVCCLSGYVLDRSGQPAFAFSILVNDIPSGKAYLAKQFQDGLCRLLISAADSQ